jgi:hypothetical protein
MQASSVAPSLAALLVSSFPRRRESNKTIVPLNTRVREALHFTIDTTTTYGMFDRRFRPASGGALSRL